MKAYLRHQSLCEEALHLAYSIASELNELIDYPDDSSHVRDAIRYSLLGSLALAIGLLCWDPHTLLTDLTFDMMSLSISPSAGSSIINFSKTNMHAALSHKDLALCCAWECLTKNPHGSAWHRIRVLDHV